MRRAALMPALAACFSLTACAGESPDPSGELEIGGDADEIAVGETIVLSWSAENADRVYLTVEADGVEPIMLTGAGLPPNGNREVEVDPSAFGAVADGDDEMTLVFKLKAMDDEPGEYETLDEESVEVSARDFG